MKRSTLLAAVIAISVVSSGTILAAAAPDKPAPAAQMMPNSKAMLDRMTEMQSEMDRIRKSTNPAERSKLMQGHMDHMSSGMQMMRGMGGEMMSGSGGMGMGAGTGMGAGGGAMMQGARPDANNSGLRMMEQRMDMLQMMMEQMVQHQQMMQPAPTK